jgi:hypothetical protein
MSRWPRHDALWTLCVCVLCVLGVGGFVGAGGIAGVDLGGVPQNQPQLERLSPSDPEQYFLLGEQLGAAAQSDQDRLLAQQVLAIGMGLADRAGEGELAASMCIALSSLETDPGIAARLWDLAVLLDPTRRSAWRAHRNALFDELEQLRETASRCLYAIRFNNSQLAQMIFEQVGTRDAILAAAERGGLDSVRVDRRISRMILDASDDSCRGRVFVAERSNGQVRRVVCPDHVRPVGTGGSDADLKLLVQLEVLLLDEPHDPRMWDGWETNAYLEFVDPTIDPSPMEFVERYGVDLAKPARRGDRWVSLP